MLTGCEQQLLPGRRPGVPTVAIVGASFTAGVGAEDPAGAWAVLLARQLHWNAFVYGVPGAGYVHPGLGQKGPVAAEVTRVHLGALQPSLIIVQAGHDDMSVPPDLELIVHQALQPSHVSLWLRAVPAPGILTTASRRQGSATSGAGQAGLSRPEDVPDSNAGAR